MNVSSNVAIFWDYENCALPATEPFYTIVNKIRRLAHQHGSVKTFKAYLQYPEQTSLKSMGLRSELQSCGVSLIDCPHNGRKDAADKMMMVDMMAHAIDNPAPATIILISGDRDFVYAVSILCLRQYKVILLAPKSASGGLKAQADLVYNWPDDFLPALPAVARPMAPILPPQTAPTPPPQSGLKRKMSTAVQATLQDIWQRRLFVPSADTHTAQAEPPPSSTPSADPDPSAVLAFGAGDPPAEMSLTGMNVDQEGLLTSQSESPPAFECRTSQSLTSSDAPAASSIVSNNIVRAPLPTTPDGMEEGEILQPPQKASAAPTPLYPPGLFSPASPAAAAFPPTPTTVTKGIPGFDNSSFYGLSASATPFIFAPSQPANPTTLPAHDSTGDDDDGTTWQTFSRVAKKRPAQIPSEFKPLVKVLKRQLAEGTSRVESSQLGTLLSAEAAHLSTIYERAGVTRLKEYTALAAEMGIVTLSKERVDGHNYIALHPVHRRKAVEHVWG